MEANMWRNYESIVLRLLVGLMFVVVSGMWTNGAHAQGCPYPVQTPFHCSNNTPGQPPCSRDIVLMVCSGGGSTECCSTTGTHVDCCGADAQNSAESGPCNGAGGCSKGGLIADPRTGRIAKACFGQFVYEKTSTPQPPPAGIAPPT